MPYFIYLADGNTTAIGGDVVEYNIFWDTGVSRVIVLNADATIDVVRECHL